MISRTRGATACLDVGDRINSVCVSLSTSVYTECHLVICRPVSALRGRRHRRSAGRGRWCDTLPSNLHDKTLHAMLTFLESEVPLMGNGLLPTLAHLLGTHYLTI